MENILNADWEGETVFSIDDPELPALLREHGAGFRNPARYVIDAGDHCYALYGGDGEFLDIVELTAKR